MIHFPFNLDQLIIFKIIIQEGSFKKASKRLYISQPAISFQIRHLEQQTNILLFKRKQKKIYITKAGFLLLNYSTRILSLCEETFHSLKTLKNIKNKNKIFIGATQCIGTYLVPYMIGVFHNRYPKTKISLHIYSVRRIIWYVLIEKIDLAIIEGKIPYDVKILVNIIPYADEEFFLILPSYYSFLKVKKMKKKDLKNFRFIVLKSNSLLKTNIMKIINENKLHSTTFKIQMELSSAEGVKHAIQAGLGVAFLPISCVTKELNKNLLYSVRIENLILKQRLFLITNASKVKSKYINYFIQEILAIFLNIPKSYFLINKIN